MRFVVIIITYLSLMPFCKTFCQQNTHEIDKALTDLYKQIMDADYNVRYDSLAPLFKKELVKYLSSPSMLSDNMDSLRKLITIVQSDDKNLKFYSWDDLTGGTWHSINAFAQFKTSGGKIQYKQINTDKEVESGGFTDSEIFEINQVKSGSITYYITFGWGTHGNGNQHMVVQVFNIQGNKLVKCKAFKSGDILSIEYPRSNKAEMKFDKTSNSISFNNYRNEDSGRPSFIGKKSLRFVHGTFR